MNQPDRLVRASAVRARNTGDCHTQICIKAFQPAFRHGAGHRFGYCAMLHEQRIGHPGQGLFRFIRIGDQPTGHGARRTRYFGERARNKPALCRIPRYRSSGLCRHTSPRRAPPEFPARPFSRPSRVRVRDSQCERRRGIGCNAFTAPGEAQPLRGGCFHRDAFRR
jgi:hypothetical protein